MQAALESSPSGSLQEVDDLWSVAERAAARRGEVLSTGHLLLALLQRRGAASDLLLEHSLTAERLRDALAKTSSMTVMEGPERVTRLVRAAIEVATRFHAEEPSGLHVLVSLLGERACHGYRVLEQAGVEVQRLRSAAMQFAFGSPSARRNRRHEAAHTVSVQAAPAPPTQVNARESGPPQQTSAQASLPFPAPSPRVREEHAPRRPARAMPLREAHKSEHRSAPVAPRGAESPRKLDPRKTPELCRCTVNLTALALAAESPAPLGCESAVERILDSLARAQGGHPLLVGPAGIGKTALLHAVARATALADGKSLDHRTLVALDPREWLAGVSSRAAFHERLRALLGELRQAQGKLVLALDGVSALLSSLDDEMMNELRRALREPGVALLATSTPEDLRKWIEPDASLRGAFAPLWLDEPSKETLAAILRQRASALELHHKVPFEERALALTVDWTTRYLPGRAQPEKSIATLDLAGARARRREQPLVGAEAIAHAIAEQSQVPAERILQSDGARMLRLHESLCELVVGHDEAMGRIAALLRRNAAGFTGQRPIGTFLLLGPSGVGKTETAKAIAQVLFGASDAMTRLDMSEYAEPHSVARLLGAPPGYVGFEAGGQLTEALRRRPYQVVLLDEIEKAHREVLQSFLQVFDEGRLTDGQGRTVSFTQAVLVLTSNLAADRLTSIGRAAGFQLGQERPQENASAADAVLQAARRALPPELYNRFDEVLVFPPLSRADLHQLVHRWLERMAQDLLQRNGLHLRWDAPVPHWLCERAGLDPALGARPLRRAIASLVEARLAEVLLAGGLLPGSTLHLSLQGESLQVEPQQPPGGASLPGGPSCSSSTPYGKQLG